MEAQSRHEKYKFYKCYVAYAEQYTGENINIDQRERRRVGKNVLKRVNWVRPTGTIFRVR